MKREIECGKSNQKYIDVRVELEIQLKIISNILVIDFLVDEMDVGHFNLVIHFVCPCDGE